LRLCELESGYRHALSKSASAESENAEPELTEPELTEPELTKPPNPLIRQVAKTWSPAHQQPSLQQGILIPSLNMPSMSIEAIIALVTLLTTCLPLGLLLWRVIKQKRRNVQFEQGMLPER
jgi:hypothetical protein